MREFHIYAFDLGKKADLTGIFNQLYAQYSPSKLIFEVSVLTWGGVRGKIIDSFNDYAYIDNYQQSSAYTKWVASNLDDNWKKPNANQQYDSISMTQVLLLLQFLQERSKHNSTAIIGLDGIDWDGTVPVATYGFEKAWRQSGEVVLSYLSPAILLLQNWQKHGRAFVTFELRKMEDTDNSSIIQEHIDTLKGILGEPLHMETRFAPNDESERPYWDRVTTQSEIAFKQMEKDSRDLIENGGLPHALTDHSKIDYSAMHANPEYKKPVNFKPIVRKAFKDTRWSYRDIKGRGQYFVTEDSYGIEYEVRFITLEKGHHIQSDISINGKMFQLWGGGYSIHLISEEEIVKYAENAVFLFELIYNRLSMRLHEIMED